MTTSDKIYIEGVEYTREELDRYCNELLNPTTPVVETKPTFSVGKELQFVTDEKLYKEIIKYLDKTFPNNPDILSKKLKFKDNVMKGSNPYIATAVDMFLKSINSKSRIATQRDLETNLEMFKGTYEDTGLVLRSLKDPNKKQAEYFYNQLKSKNPNIKFPIFADLRGLTLDDNLNFNLTDNSNYKTADCLNLKSGTHFFQTDEFGFPKSEDENSSRQIWTGSDGLVGLYLDGDLDLSSYYEGLSNSDGYGRVVLAKSF